MDFDALAHYFTVETNLALNPRFESGFLQRLAFPGGGLIGEISPSSGVQDRVVLDGAFSLLVAAGDSIPVAMFAAAPGGPVSVAALAGLSSGTAAGAIDISFYDAANTLLGARVSAPYGGVESQVISTSALAPAGTALCVVSLNASGVGQIAFDRVMVSETNEPIPFFDGDAGGCYWTGARYCSASSRFGSAAELEFMIETCSPHWSEDSLLGTSLPLEGTDGPAPPPPPPLVEVPFSYYAGVSYGGSYFGGV